MSLASTLEIIAELKAGRMVILVDEEDRENEGDLVIAAEFVTPEAINFMARYGRGLICLTLTQERCTPVEPAADDPPQRHAVRHGVHGQHRSGRRRDHRHLRRRPRPHDRRRRRARRASRAHRPARPRVPDHGATGRRAGARRPHRGRLRLHGAGRPHAGRGDLRSHQGRRHDGAPARPDRIRQAARAEDRHDRGSDPLPQPHRIDRRARWPSAPCRPRTARFAR